MKEYKTRIQRIARYFILGEPGINTKKVWFVCHGYGQLAEYFIQHFEGLTDDETIIVAPEALSRFYWNGFSGRVGASWMTKDLRLEEIEDYTNYLQQVLEEIEELTGHKSFQINILGFSQGCATVCRWITLKGLKPQKLVIWAGTFPHDIDYPRFSYLLKTTKVSVVYGNQDEFFSEKEFLQHLSDIEQKGIDFQSVSFEGKHELHKPTIAMLMPD